jgi:hypothetical protein
MTYSAAVISNDYYLLYQCFWASMNNFVNGYGNGLLS